MEPGLKVELETMFENFAKSLLPAIDTAAKAAVTATMPVAAVIADPLIDFIDAKIAALLGAPAVVVTTPDTVDARLTAIENHVAALTVATGAATSQGMATTKAAVPVIAAAPVAEVEGG